MIEFEDIKSAMRYINNSERDLTVRKTKIYDTKTKFNSAGDYRVHLALRYDFVRHKLGFTNG